MAKTEVVYTRGDVGCYVGSARGIYATDAIVEFARAHGADIPACDPTDHTHDETHNESELAGCEFSMEIEDDANAYMEEHYPVEGCYWGRNENGDWGLWSCDDDDVEEEEDDGITEGDIVTADHKHWYQDGRLYCVGDEQALKSQMDDDQYWPNVWWVSDHGNPHLLTLGEGQ